MTGPLDLDDPACLEPGTAGAKAARLAAARAAGLPALPGLLLPVAAGEAALRAGRAILARQGRHAARLAVSQAGLPAALAGELEARAGRLGGTLVARSSSPLEGSGAWSGAFTSYLGVRPAELPVAVAGCWASAFSTDALERCERLGLDPDALRLAVLVQPEVRPRVSGTAEVAGDGTVTVVGVDGPPAPLVSGWKAGHVATVRGGEVTSGAQAAARLGRPALLAAAELAGAVREALGCDAIEWAVLEGGRAVLLQAGRRQEAPAGSATAGEPAPALPPGPAARAGWRAARLLAAEVLQRGERRYGQPAAPGVAAGLAWPVQSLADLPRAQAAGRVLVAPLPLPHLAPLLWGAAALVTAGGGPGAHLLHVARSLGVPAVVGCDLAGLLHPDRPPPLVGVDGTAGIVAVASAPGQPEGA